MPYNLQITKTVQKTLSANTVLAKRFYEWTTEVCNNPYSANDGAMTNYFYDGLPVYKKRIGSYRALYVVKELETLVLVFKLASRGDVYKD